MQEKIKWLRLIRTEGIGPVRFWQLLRQHKTVDRVLATLDCPYPYEKACEEIDLHHKQGFQLLAAFEPCFPALLKQHKDCPPLLSLYGNPEFLSRPMIAIVGARNASFGGRQISLQLANDLGHAGWIIISGLARGIDEKAHQGSLATGTVGVLAGGIDCIYPPEHRSLYTQMAKQGVVISEMPLGVSPAAGLFPRRNRLIAGLSQAVVVIEAAVQSGSLITADYALNQGKEIFVIPGSPLDPRCSGSNKLIKQGAFLVESAQDILDVLGKPQVQEHPCSFLPTTSLDQGRFDTIQAFDKPLTDKNLKEQLLIDLSPTAVEIENLLTSYPYPPSVILGLLSELELEGRIQRHPGQLVSLIQATSS